MKLIIILFFCASLQAQNNKPIAKPDTFKINVLGNVLSNDKDMDNDILSVSSYKVNGVSYAPRLTSRLIPNFGTITFKKNGEFISDGSGLVTYNISDGKYGTATSTILIQSKKLIARTDNFYTFTDIRFMNNVLWNDSVLASDSFKIIGMQFMSENLKPLGTIGQCFFVGSNSMGCFGMFENGLFWWENLENKLIEDCQLPTIFYIAKNKRGEIIYSNIELTIKQR